MTIMCKVQNYTIINCYLQECDKRNFNLRQFEGDIYNAGNTVYI